MTEDEDFYDDIPWADPSIQRDYQAALGQFLVQFNAIEAAINDILEMSLDRFGRGDLYIPTERFTSKLRTLQLVGLALPEMHKPDISRLRRLNGERNRLAHGHFDQNPYSGEFVLVAEGKSHEKSIETIQTITAEAKVAWNDVRFCMAFLWFADAPAVLPPGASSEPTS